MATIKEWEDLISSRKIKISNNRLTIQAIKLCEICNEEEATGEIVETATDKRIAVCYSWRGCHQTIDWDSV
jgi:hypothetical protein